MEKEILVKNKAEAQKDILWMYIQDQTLLIIRNSQHLAIYLFSLTKYEIFSKKDDQLTTLKRCRSLSTQYESKMFINDSFCYELNCK